MRRFNRARSSAQSAARCALGMLTAQPGSPACFSFVCLFQALTSRQTCNRCGAQHLLTCSSAAVPSTCRSSRSTPPRPRLPSPCAAGVHTATELAAGTLLSAQLAGGVRQRRGACSPPTGVPPFSPPLRSPPVCSPPTHGPTGGLSRPSCHRWEPRLQPALHRPQAAAAAASAAAPAAPPQRSYVEHPHRFALIMLLFHILHIFHVFSLLMDTHAAW